MDSDENLSREPGLERPFATQSKDGVSKLKKRVIFALKQDQKFPSVPGVAVDTQKQDKLSKLGRDPKEEGSDFTYTVKFSEDEPRYLLPSLDDVENVEKYRPGGFHPVRMGDRIGGQYKIIHKLGHGGFGTVWLARDLAVERYVALKIVMSKSPKKTVKHDLKILEHLAKHIDQPGANFVDTPIEYFWITGPNGNHLCIISEIAGPSIAQLTQSGVNIDRKDAQRMVLQVTQCLSFLHSQKIGVAHGDLTTSNVLLGLSAMDSVSEENMYELLGHPVGERIRPFEDKPLGTSAPDFIYQPVDLTKLSQYYSGNIIFIDYGAAFFLDDIPDSVGIPSQFSAPELLIHDLCGKHSDLWALACTIFEIRSGNVLFDKLTGGDKDVLMGMRGILGPFPPSLTDGEDFEWLKLAVGNDIGLKELIFDIKGISDDEAYALYDLLKRSLRYDIEDRLTVEGVLRHPWLSYHFQVSGERTVGLAIK